MFKKKKEKKEDYMVFNRYGILPITASEARERSLKRDLLKKDDLRLGVQEFLGFCYEWINTITKDEFGKYRAYLVYTNQDGNLLSIFDSGELAYIIDEARERLTKMGYRVWETSVSKDIVTITLSWKNIKD